MYFVLDKITNLISGPFFVVLLIGTGLFFTIYLRFPQFRFFFKSLRILLFPYDNQSSDSTGETSPLQALSASIGGSLGVGSITGVALAIHIGGPSSIFWIVVTAFFGMATKISEVTICHSTRTISRDGTMYGGPNTYIEKLLNKKWLASIYVFCSFLASIGAGNLMQANSISKAVFLETGIDTLYTGIILSILIGIIIIGGVSRIGQVAEKLVPSMALVYIVLSISIILSNKSGFLLGVKSIFTNILDPYSISGGFIGTSISVAINTGVNRGFVASDAGTGAAGILHSSSRESDSKKVGILAMIEPFLTTAIMCSFTGVVILTAQTWNKKVEHRFDTIDTLVFEENLREDHQSKRQLSRFFDDNKGLKLYSGELQVQEGVITNKEISIVNSHSIAEEVKFISQGKKYNGKIRVHNGEIQLDSKTSIYGKSLLSEMDLANYTFRKGMMGKWGPRIMSLCLILFAFTTIMAYFYYCDRAVLYFGGGKKILILNKVFFLIILIIGSTTQPTIIWQITNIAYSMMAIPNLISLWLVRGHIKKFFV